MPTYVPLIPFPVQFQDSVTSLNMVNGTLEFFLAGTSTPTNLFSDNSGTSIGNSIGLNSGGYPEAGGNVITLFRDSSIALKIIGLDASDVTKWTSDNLEDALVILASVSNAKGASLIGIEDNGSYFAGLTVEEVLQEIGDLFFKTTRGDIITAPMTFTGAGGIDMAALKIKRPFIQDYAIVHQIISSSSGTLTIDMETGNSFSTLLTENITTINIVNPPINGYAQIVLEITQDGVGGSYTLPSAGADWPGVQTTLFPGGNVISMSTGNDAVDTVTLNTRDGGLVWKGDFSQSYAEPV